MRKGYEEPSAEFILYAEEDIITSSDIEFPSAEEPTFEW